MRFVYFGFIGYLFLFIIKNVNIKTQIEDLFATLMALWKCYPNTSAKATVL